MLEVFLTSLTFMLRDKTSDSCGIACAWRFAAGYTAARTAVCDVSAGADREPELLQHIFGCLSSVLRHLAQWLAADMPKILQQTARLRYHSARHVRQLAAQSMGFLLRHARGKALRAGVRTVYAGLRPAVHSTCCLLLMGYMRPELPSRQQWHLTSLSWLSRSDARL